VKLATFVNRGQDRIGVVGTTHVFDLGGVQKFAKEIKSRWTGLGEILDVPFPESMAEFLKLGQKGLDGAHRAVDFALTFMEQGDLLMIEPYAIPLDKVQWRTPIPDDPYIWCIGGNSPNTLRAKKFEATDYPYGFGKPTFGIRGHMEPIQIPEFFNWYRWTPELGVVLWRDAKNVSLEEALDCVVGYTCCNDMACQHHYTTVMAHKKPHFLDMLVASYYGKYTDDFMPIGPYITTKDEVGDVYDLLVYGRQSGVFRDRGHTCAMVNGVEQTISTLSEYMTLPSGSILSMGAMHTDGLAIKEVIPPGGYMEVDIERVGCLRNPIVDCRKEYRP
jgi:2-keto-4-pentenoate hydratase/2-oxohepta-3-ene-1,7-dioic acid hydratase in catechol pathway